MSIVLCGPTGVGKSRVASALAAILDKEVVDTDILLQDRYNDKHNTRFTYSEIFEEVGEKKFRQLEKELFQEMPTETIIALGGGMIDVKELVRPLGTVIYLRAKPETLWERIMEKPKLPSFLPQNDPRSFFCHLIAERAPFYEQMANIILDTDQLRVEEVARTIQLTVNSERIAHGFE